MATSCRHPSDVVEVMTRDREGRARTIRGLRESFRGDRQTYRVNFSGLQRTPVEYRVLLSRAGRVLASLPEHQEEWLKWDAAAPQPAAAHVPAPPPPPGPRYHYELEFFAALTVNLRPQTIGATPDGYRINFFVNDGTVRGPHIEAEMLPEGGDWMAIRPDGVGVIDAKTTWKTTDGALILDQAGGVFDLGPEGYAHAAAGIFVGTPPLYATPTLSTSHPDWLWLNRCSPVGIGRVVLEKLQVQCDLYIPRVGDRLDG